MTASVVRGLVFGVVLGALVAASSSWQPAVAAEPALPAPPMRLRIVGGLDGLNQYRHHEEPFWTQRLAQLTAGRYTADIVPFDRAGIRGPDMLAMVALGTIPFGTVLLSQTAPRDIELAAPDLAGLNPDMVSLRRSVSAFRPQLANLLRDRHGVELLAVYTYPAQVLFCKGAVSLADGLGGRRVRTTSPTQSDWVEAFGGKPVSIPFAEVLPNMRSGNTDCAITGTMTGFTVGLFEHATHIVPTPVTWGLATFVVHGATWRSLPADLRDLLRTELQRLEAAIWDESARETSEGVACNVGDAACRSPRPGRMAVVRGGPGEEQRQREVLTQVILPRWLQRCGPACAESWNRSLGPATGLKVPAR